MSSAITDPSSKLQSQNTETNAVIPDKSSDIVENGLKVRPDAIESIQTDAEPLKPSSTTIEEGKSSDITDDCRPTFVPMSPPSASTRIPHQFTKMRPNLPQTAKTKKRYGRHLHRFLQFHLLILLQTRINAIAIIVRFASSKPLIG